MGKRIRIIKIVSFIIILVEVLLIAGFSILYFTNTSGIADNMNPQTVVLACTILAAIDCLFVWGISISVASLRHKTDLHAAEVIGSDVQEAYNFAMIGLAVTDKNDNVLWTNDLFKNRHIDIIDTNILSWQPVVIKNVRFLSTLVHMMSNSSSKRAYGSLKMLPISKKVITILKTKHQLSVY